MEFEEFAWDDEKASFNLRKHNISFVEAVRVFDDPNATELLDETHSDSEIRFRIVGLSGAKLIIVVFTERIDTIRIISARKATPAETKIYNEKKK